MSVSQMVLPEGKKKSNRERVPNHPCFIVAKYIAELCMQPENLRLN